MEVGLSSLAFYLFSSCQSWDPIPLQGTAVLQQELVCPNALLLLAAAVGVLAFPAHGLPVCPGIAGRTGGHGSPRAELAGGLMEVQQSEKLGHKGCSPLYQQGTQEICGVAKASGYCFVKGS